jgi:replicative DNA helicase
MTTYNINKVPPQNLDAEQEVIGTCLLGSKHIPDAIDKLVAGDFYKNSHKVIFGAISELYREGTQIDLVSVSDLLKNNNQLDEAGSISYLAHLTSMIPTNIKNHCRIITDAAIKREIIIKFSEVVDTAFNGSSTTELLDNINNIVLSLRSDGKKEPKHIREILPKVMEEIETRYKDKTPVTGISTGLKDLDRRMGGLNKSNYIIVAGRPGMGKTSLALKFAESASKNGEVVLVFSLEMAEKRLASRLVSMESKVEGDRMRTGFMDSSDFPKIEKAMGKMSDRDIIIDDSSALTIAEITARTKKTNLKNKVSLVIIDYIQLMRGSRGSENRAKELTDISRGLLALAKDIDAPVVVLSQLNRGVEARKDKRPVMSDLKESGAMEEDADVVLLLYRDEEYNKSPDNPNKGTAEIIIGKGRDIGTWIVKVGFEGKRHEFYDLMGGWHERV